VFINGKESPRRTQRGQLRIPALGKVTVQVKKKGFDDPLPKTVTVAKGAEVRVGFVMRPPANFSVLDISGGIPGAEVYVDDQHIGTVGVDGRFLNSSVMPGVRVVEMRREQYETKRYQRNFPPGGPVTISGTDAALVAIKLPPPPPPPEIPKTEAPPPPPPTPKVVVPKVPVGTIAQFDNAGEWKQTDGVYVRKGGGVSTYSLTPNGVFTFTIHMVKAGGLFRGGRVRWVVQYLNARDYLLYELDNEILWCKVVENGKTYERKKIAHGLNKDLRNWTIQVDLSAKEAVQKIERGGQWVTLDTFNEPGRDFTKGKFGILVNGDDEVGLSGFQFMGR